MNEHKLRERVLELLDYNPETGVFTWKISRGRKRAGGVAGTLMNTGYISMKIDGKKHLAHRLAHLIVHGYFPEQVDHINLIKDDNRIENLREATRQENKRNTLKQSSNTSGFKGVSWKKHSGKWRAQAQDGNGKYKHLGYFVTVEAAAQAYDDYAMKLHGEFYRPTPSAAI